MKSVRNYAAGLLIVDYQTTPETKSSYMERVSPDFSHS